MKSTTSEFIVKLSKPMYGTRPYCLVQAITWHTCPDPHLGSWNCSPHQAHIAPSEPMSNMAQQSSSLGSFQTFPPFIPTVIGVWAFELVSSRVWWEAATNKENLLLNKLFQNYQLKNTILELCIKFFLLEFRVKQNISGFYIKQTSSKSLTTIDWFGLVYLFNGISTRQIIKWFVGYLMPKPFS